MGKSRSSLCCFWQAYWSGMLALPAGAVDLQLAAPSAVLMDLATGRCCAETNSHERLAPASVSK